MDGTEASDQRPSTSYIDTLRSGAASGYIVDVPLDPDQTIDNPENLREELTDLDDLAASILGGGLIQYLVVTPADEFLAAHPQASLPPEALWVLDAGHRRRAAGLVAGLTTLPGVVRGRDVGESDGIIDSLKENFHRVALTPMEEARGLAKLSARGMSQREITAKTGISQPQVSKRLQLTELPAIAQTAIQDHLITVNDALEVLRRDLPDKADQQRAVELVVDEDHTLVNAVRQVRRERTAPTPATEERAPSAEPAVAGETAPATQPQTVPPSPPGDEPGDEHAATSSLVGPQTPGVEQDLDGQASALDLTVSGAGPADTSSGSGENTPHAPAEHVVDDFEMHKRAALARAEACRGIAQGSSSASEVKELLVDLALVPPTAAPLKALKTALSWLRLPEDDVEGTLERLLHSGRRNAERIAVAASLARREADLSADRFARDPWPPAARRHVERLVAWNAHTLSDFEERKLAEPLPD